MHRSTVVVKLSAAIGDDDICEQVHVPVLQNLRPLKEGEELLEYKETPATKACTIEPAPSLKKRPAESALHQPPNKTSRRK